MTQSRAGMLILPGAGIAALILLPFLLPDYILHIAVQILLWSVIYTAWAIMGSTSCPRRRPTQSVPCVYRCA